MQVTCILLVCWSFSNPVVMYVVIDPLYFSPLYVFFILPNLEVVIWMCRAWRKIWKHLGHVRLTPWNYCYLMPNLRLKVKNIWFLARAVLLTVLRQLGLLAEFGRQDRAGRELGKEAEWKGIQAWNWGGGDRNGTGSQKHCSLLDLSHQFFHKYCWCLLVTGRQSSGHGLLTRRM